MYEDSTTSDVELIASQQLNKSSRAHLLYADQNSFHIVVILREKMRTLILHISLL